MNTQKILMYLSIFTITLIGQTVFAGAQAIAEVDNSCGYQFQQYEAKRLISFGWSCTPENKAVAERMFKRGFSSKQYVDAYAIFRDIPRLKPEELESVAALHLVDINPKYFYSVDESERLTPMEAYNRLHTKRGRILSSVGFSLAGVGAVLATVGMVQLLTDDPYIETPTGRRYDVNRLNENPMGAAFAFSGFISLAAGIGIGSLGAHKLSLRSDQDILGTMSMERLSKRRCKVHHFTPEDFYYDLYDTPTVKRPNFIRTSMILNPKLIALGVTVSF